MMPETKKRKIYIALILIIAMLLPAIISTGCAADPTPAPEESTTVSDEPAGEPPEEPVQESDPPDDTLPPEETGNDTGGEVVGIARTYVGKATATEAEYFRVKENLYFSRVEVGATNEIALTIILDETTGQYYVDGVPAEETELPDGGIHLEAFTEYEGSMSMTTLLSLSFVEDGKILAGTMTNIIYVYGSIAAREIWSITAFRQ